MNKSDQHYRNIHKLLGKLDEELYEEIKSKAPKEDDEFTLREFLDATQMGEDAGRKWLNKKVEEGKMEKRISGRYAYYRPVTKDD